MNNQPSRRVLTCVYCGKEYPEGCPSWGPNNQVLTDHIKICEKHPMRALEEENAKLQESLQFCYDRLSHLLYIWNNPKSVQAGFGPQETMSILDEELPKIKSDHNLTDGYKHKK